MRRRNAKILAVVLMAALALPLVAAAQNQTLHNIPVPGSSTSGQRIHTDGARVHQTLQGALKFDGVTHATLGSYDLGPGTLIYCTDCTKASPCASGGAGAWAKRRSSASGAGASGGFDCD